VGTTNSDRLIQRDCDNMFCDDIRDLAKSCNIESTGEETGQIDSDYITRKIEVLTRFGFHGWFCL